MKEARPTEYRGVVYKSKTEAMFACLIDVNQKEKNQRVRLRYEPEIYKTPGGYIPDFVLDQISEPFLCDFTTLIELKPSMPTQAYINYLDKQFKWIRNKDYFQAISFYAMYVFNPYDHIFQYILFDKEYIPTIEEFETPAWFKDYYFNEVLKYRFDLQSNI